MMVGMSALFDGIALECVDRPIHLNGEWRAVEICQTVDEARERLDSQP